MDTEKTNRLRLQNVTAELKKYGKTMTWLGAAITNYEKMVEKKAIPKSSTERTNHINKARMAITTSRRSSRERLIKVFKKNALDPDVLNVIHNGVKIGFLGNHEPAGEQKTLERLEKLTKGMTPDQKFQVINKFLSLS